MVKKQNQALGLGLTLLILLLLALSPIGLNVIRLQTLANQWVNFDTSATNINAITALDCEPGAYSACWSGPASLTANSWSNKNVYGIGTCNVQGCSNNAPGASGSNFLMPLSQTQSASTACQNGQGWQISNACALGSIAIGGGQNLPLQSPQAFCQGYSGLQYYSCVFAATPPQSTYTLNANLLPAKLLGQDGNFTSRFGEQCTASLTEACPSSPLCPSSAPTGCQTLTRTGVFNGQQVQIIDLIYSLGVDLRIQLQGQKPVFTILCNGVGIGLSGLTNGPCAGAAVAALQGPLAFTNTNVLTSGKIAVDITAPLFAYSSPYDFYGFWNGYIANSGCVPATNISPCTSHASLGIGGSANFKDPSQWTATDFINLPVNTLASTAVITISISSLGPVYSVTVQKPGGNASDCQSDLNQGTSATGTCTLTIGGQSLIDVPIVFQELAQVKINVPGPGPGGTGGTCYSPSGTVNASCINKNPITSGTIKISNLTQSFKYLPGGNIGNITRTFQNSTSPLETIIVKVTDTSGIWGFLIPLGGMVVTLNPIGSILTTNSSGIVIFEGVPPPVGAVPYSVSAIDPGGYTIFFFTIPPNHNPAGPVGVPNLGTGTYWVPVVMVTSYAGVLTIMALVFIFLIVIVAVGVSVRLGLGRVRH